MAEILSPSFTGVALIFLTDGRIVMEVIFRNQFLCVIRTKRFKPLLITGNKILQAVTSLLL